NEPTSANGIGQLIMTQGDRAWGWLKIVVSSAASLLIGLFVLTAGIYTMLIDGGRAYKWIVDHAPIGPGAVRRFGAAFNETGRGLMFGVVGAGALQALAATAAFLVLGVPQAFALGLLTLVFSLLPAIGTALVWAPVAAGLAITGRLYAALILAIFGIAV